MPSLATLTRLGTAHSPKASVLWTKSIASLLHTASPGDQSRSRVCLAILEGLGQEEESQVSGPFSFLANRMSSSPALFASTSGELSPS